MQSGLENACPPKKNGSMPRKVQITETIHGATSFKRAFAMEGKPERQRTSLLFQKVVRHSTVMTCVAMSGNGPEASGATVEHGSVLFVVVLSSKPKDQAGMQMEVHNPVTSQRSSFSCGRGLTAARQSVFAVWLMSLTKNDQLAARLKVSSVTLQSCSMFMAGFAEVGIMEFSQ